MCFHRISHHTKRLQMLLFILKENLCVKTSLLMRNNLILIIRIFKGRTFYIEDKNKNNDFHIFSFQIPAQQPQPPFISPSFESPNPVNKSL